MTCDECGRSRHRRGCPQGRPDYQHPAVGPARPWLTAAQRMLARQPYNDPWTGIDKARWDQIITEFSAKALS